jgi:hypothetical protein
MSKIRLSDKAYGVVAGAGASYTAYPPTAGNAPAITAVNEAETVSVEAKITLAADVVINDTIVGFILPAGHVPVDLLATSDDLDTGAAMTITVGVLDATLTALVATTNFITADTVCQAGGVVRANVAAGLRLAPVAYDRYIGILVVAAPNASQAGTLTINGSYRASNAD